MGTPDVYSPIYLDKVGLLRLANHFSHEVGASLLYSGHEFDSAKRSFLFLYPTKIVLIGEEAKESFQEGGQDPWDRLKSQLSFTGTPYPEWVGFLSYEIGAFSDREKQISSPPTLFPKAFFMQAAVVLSVDHETNLATLVVHQKKNLLMATSKILPLPPCENRLLSQSDNEESYKRKILQIQESLYEGDVYQVNLSQQFLFQRSKTPYQMFHRLSEMNPAPFSAYLSFGNFAIVSSSPERFLKKEGTFLETRPIKGTIARGTHLKEDRQNKNELLHSIKNRAELVMITDLMRNDLGRISLPGSVKVEKLMACEAYTNVFHLLSVIGSQVSSSLHPLEILRATFPGGSITGCPKLSAMEKISQLEKRARGIYTGSIGYFTGKGDFDFNIAIRTLFVTTEHVNVQLGGAIVADSDPTAEYEETFHKGFSIFQMLNENPLKAEEA